MSSKKAMYGTLAIAGLGLAFAWTQQRPGGAPVLSVGTSERVAREDPAKDSAALDDTPIGNAKNGSAPNWWESYPNNSSSFGKEIPDEGPSAFLNAVVPLLRKPLKSSADMRELAESLSIPSNYQAISAHYESLPKSFHFVEEASRVKMILFLSAGLELGQPYRAEAEKVIVQIAGVDPQSLADAGLAQSIAGDQVRLLSALRLYDSSFYRDNFLTDTATKSPSIVKIVKHIETKSHQGEHT